MSLLDPFAPAQSIADAVLYEGYVLYPYRASSDKNKVRWQWGVVGPPGAHDDGVGEEATMATDLPVLHDGNARLHLRLRALRVITRRVERLGPEAPEPIESVTIGDRTHVSFDDSEVVHVDTTIDLPTSSTRQTVPFVFGDDLVVDQLGQVDGLGHQLVRARHRTTGELSVEVEQVTDEVAILHVEVRNTTPWRGGGRDEAVARSLVGAHVLGAAEGGLFLSVVDPPDEHAAAVASCSGHRLWPVVVGAAQRASLVLASPVILSDQPEIAPESQGTFYDGLEIDELLTLRVLTMTDEEKAEARATDPRSADIVDRVENMSPDDLASLHGTIRAPGLGADPADDLDIPTIVGDGSSAEAMSDTEERPWWDPGIDERFDPDIDAVVVGGTPISRGSVVELHPGKRADAHDIFYRDRVATVAAIVHDVDGSIHVAVTLDDDPAADLNDATGRYLYFSPDEVEPLGRRVER